MLWDNVGNFILIIILFEIIGGIIINEFGAIRK